MGGLLDVYIEMKPADQSRFASFSEYAAARQQGLLLSKTVPEDAARQLFALADETEQELRNADNTGVSAADRRATEALVLYARYHARKILAGANLAVFYQSSDASFLRTGTSHAVAGLEIWERLVRVADQNELPQEFFGKADTDAWNESLILVRHDVRCLQERRRILDRYGLFDLGLDFGPVIKPARGPYGMVYARAFSLEQRFSPLDPEMTYSRKRGYGWLDCTGISASTSVRLLDPFVPGRFLSDSILPEGTLSGNLLRGREKSTLLVDLPDGNFRVTTIIANQPEVASGSFKIQAVDTGGAPVGAIVYAAGETGDKSMETQIRGGRLVLEFVPEPGEDWLVNALIITRRAPHVGHVPVSVATAGSATNLDATITAPDGVSMAELHLSVDRRMILIPMLADGLEFTARLDLLPAWTHDEVGYSILARDTAGHACRWPAAGFVRIRVSQ